MLLLWSKFCHSYFLVIHSLRLLQVTLFFPCMLLQILALILQLDFFCWPSTITCFTHPCRINWWEGRPVSGIRWMLAIYQILWTARRRESIDPVIISITRLLLHYILPLHHMHLCRRCVPALGLGQLVHGFAAVSFLSYHAAYVCFVRGFIHWIAWRLHMLCTMLQESVIS